MLHKSMYRVQKLTDLQVTVFKFYPSDPTYLIGGPCLRHTAKLVSRVEYQSIVISVTKISKISNL